MKEGPTIAISGPPGSGKTTYAKRLATELGLAYYSAGMLFREIANRKGIDLYQLNMIAARDPTIDIEIDKRTMELGRQGGIVIEGHLVAWVLADIADVKIYVTAPLHVRIKRIARRESRSLRDVLTETLAREWSQQIRFMTYYGLDTTNLSIFDLIVNTDGISIEQAYTVIRSYTCMRLVNKGYRVQGCSEG